MPSYRAHTDKGSFVVKSDRALDPTEITSAVTGSSIPKGITVDPEPPSAGAMLRKGAEDVNYVTSGGEPNASFPRTLGRAAGGVAGAVGGGALGTMLSPGPGTIAGSVGGAGVGTAVAEAALEALSGEHLQPRRIAKQAGASMLTEGGGQAVRAGVTPLARSVGLTRTLTPAQDLALRSARGRGISMRASEITDSGALARIEKAPTYLPTGYGPYQEFSERQAAAALRALRSGASVPEFSAPQVQAEIARVGELAKEDIPRSLAARRRLESRLYTRVEQLAGDEPVVDLGPVVKKAQQLRKDAQVIGGPRAVTTLAKKGEAVPQQFSDDMKVILKGLGYSEGEVPEWAQQVLQGQPVDLRVPFRVARQLETELGEQARFGTQTSVSRSRTRALYSETRRSIDAYLNSPAGAAVKPELQQAKQMTRDIHKLFDKGVNKQLLDKNPEQVVRRVFRPGQLSELQVFKQAVDPQTFEATKIAWMAGLIDEATTPQGRFQPAKFEKLLRPYLNSGQVGEAFGPRIEAEMNTLSDLMARMKAADWAAANPSGTGQAMGGMRQVELGGKLLLLPATAFVLGAGALGAGATAGAELAIPWITSKWFMSNQGINTLMRGFSGRYSSQALRVATQLAIQAYEADAR